MKWGELAESEELIGYYRGIGNGIDKEVAEDGPCPECKGKCRYVSMENGRGSYRAFAVCNECGEAHEF